MGLVQGGRVRDYTVSFVGPTEGEEPIDAATHDYLVGSGDVNKTFAFQPFAKVLCICSRREVFHGCLRTGGPDAGKDHCLLILLAGTLAGDDGD